MTTSTRVRGMKLLQYLLGVVALGWVVQQTAWGRVVALLTTIPPSVVVALVGVTVVGLLARFYTWHALLVERRRLPFSAAATIDLSVNFINHLLPSRVSGRSVAPLVVRHHTDLSWADSTAITGMHTGLYALLYGAVATIGLLAGFPRLSPGILLVIGLSTGLYLAVGATIILAGSQLDVLGGLAGRLRSVASRVPVLGERLAGVDAEFASFTADSAAAFRSILGQRSTLLLYAVAWLGAMVLAPGLRVWLLLDVFGVSIQPAVLLPAYLVAAYSVTLLPLTPGGIGVTEATATVVFTALGLPVDVVVPTIFVDRFLGVYLPALSGWYPAVRMDIVDRIAG